MAANPLPSGLICFACGRLAVTDEDLDFLDEPINWTEKTDKSAVCSTQTFAQHWFRRGDLWSSPCRAVFTENNFPDKFENFHLSAVFQPVHWTARDGTMRIPLSQDVVYAGHPPANYTNTVSMPEDAIYTWSHKPPPFPQFCALFHERCWCVMAHALGDSLPQHVNALMATMYAAEREIFATPIAQTPENRPRIRRYLTYVAKQHALAGFMHVDPWRIPEVDVTISKARLARQRIRAEGPYPFALSPRVHLPLDVQMLIVDQMEDEDDVCNALTAFEWQFPDGYWKARIPKDVVFEYEAIKDEDIHWPALYYLMQKLLRESHGLRKRQQILNLVEYVRPIYERLVAEEDGES